MTLIEFTEDTAKRKKGDRLRVDDASARSFVDKKNVAKRIDEAAEAAAAEEATTVADTTPVSETETDTPTDAGDESESEDDEPETPASGVFSL